MKRWGKSPPATRVTGTARQTPPGARSRSCRPRRTMRARPRAARPSARVDCWRLSATAVVDGWSPPGCPERVPGTEPGLQTSPSALHRLTCRNSPVRPRQSAQSPQELGKRNRSPRGSGHRSPATGGCRCRASRLRTRARASLGRPSRSRRTESAASRIPNSSRRPRGQTRPVHSEAGGSPLARHEHFICILGWIFPARRRS